jgi:uncharacterized LabA/DUF88 family protein
MVKNKPTAIICVDQNNIFFRYKKLDFRCLLQEIKKDFDIIKATSYMALDQESDSQKKFITYLSNNGYKCVTVDIAQDTNIDHILIADMTNDYKNLKPDSIILVSGDGHFAYALDLCSKQGALSFVIGAKDFVSFDLLKVADRIKYLEDFHGVVPC